MSNLVWIGVIGVALIALWIWCAYTLGKTFGKQEEFLANLKQRNKEYRQEILDKQAEMEREWQEHWEQVQADMKDEKPDTPVPTEPTKLRNVR